MKNKIMLITYADSFGKNLKEVKKAIDVRRPGICAHRLPPGGSGIRKLGGYPLSCIRL